MYKYGNWKIVFTFLLVISGLRLAINLWISDKVPPLPEEVEMIKIAKDIKKGEFNFKYSFFPFIIALLTEVSEKDPLSLSRTFSSILGSISIPLSFVLTKNIFLPLIISAQPMHVYISSTAKADILIFIFTLISIFSIARIHQGREDIETEKKYSRIAGVCSSACIIFKYFFPTALASFISSLVISRSRRQSAKQFLIFFTIPIAILFLPFIVLQSQNFLNSVKEQYELHMSSVLLGEKNMISVIFSVSSSVTTLSPYSILVLGPIILSVIYMRKEATPYILFFLISFLSLYLSSPHIFSHYYYPISLPLLFLLSGGINLYDRIQTSDKSRQKARIVFLLFSGILIVCMSKTRDMNFLWLDELKKEIVEKSGKVLLVLTKPHQFLEYVIPYKLNVDVDTLIYDIEKNSDGGKNISYISKKYSHVIIDRVRRSERETPVLEQIEEELRKACVMQKSIDSFKVLELDRFEKFFFPGFKNILFHFEIEIWRCKEK